MKKTTLIIVAIVIVGVIIYALSSGKLPSNTKVSDNNNVTDNTTDINDNSTTTPNTINSPTIDKTKTVIGSSVQKRNITAYHFGSGASEILFIGGAHGGYSWNTTLLAYNIMDYLKANPNDIPSNIKVTVIPVLNPDGLFKVVGTDGRFSNADVSTSQSTLISGRFNANNVDLNRNFDCNWTTNGVWQKKEVSGGSKVFSEPESIALKNYVDSRTLSATVVFYSAAGGVYASSCNGAPSTKTMGILNTYAKASGYPAHDSYDFYETTGDIANWLASKNIPTISVLLTNHKNTEWQRNLDGIKSLLKYYAN